MRDILVIAITIVCSCFALRRPVFGLMAFVCFGFLNPQTATWGIAQTFRSSLLIGGATLVGFVLSSESKKFPRERESFLLLALWGVFGLSTYFAIYPHVSIVRFIEVSKILLMVFLSTVLINTEERLNAFLRVIALSLGFYGLKGGFFTLVTGGNYTIWGPEGTFISNNTTLGLALTMNIPILLYLLKIESRPWLKWLMRATVVLSYLTIFATYSRGAWIALAIVAALTFTKSTRKILLTSLAAILAIPTLLFLPQHLPQKAQARYGDLVNYEEEESAQARLWSWEFCKRVGLARPMTGGGFDFPSNETYTAYYPEFVEHYVQTRGKITAWSCHSLWFSVLGEHGLPGFILELWLLISCWLTLRQIRAYGKAQPEILWVGQYCDMVQFALVGFMVAGSFLDVAYFDLFYYLVGLIIIRKNYFRSRTKTLYGMPSPARVFASNPQAQLSN